MTKLSILLRTGMLALAAALLLVSCADREVRAELDDIESYIEIRPDSALAAIRAIDTLRLQTRAMRAQYSLLHAMALDKNYIDTTDLHIIEPALKWYRHHGNIEKRAKSLYYQAVAIQNAGDYTNSTVIYLDILQMLGRVTDLNFCGRVYSMLAYAHKATGDYDTALNYQLQAVSMFKECGTPELRNISEFELASCYADAGHFDMAEQLFEGLLEKSDLSDALRWSIECDYAYYLVSISENYSRAFALFEAAWRDRAAFKDPADYSVFAYLLALEGRCDEADFILSQFVDSDPLRGKYWQSKVCAIEGDYVSAYNNLSTSIALRDTLVYQFLSQSVSRSKADYYKEKHKTAALQRQRMTMSLAIVLLVAVVVILVALFLAMRRREKENEERARLQLIAETLNLQLAEVERKLEDETYKLRLDYLKRNRYLFVQIYDIAEYMLRVSHRHDADKYKEAFMRIGKTVKEITTVDNQAAFEQSLNATMDNVMSEIRRDVPELSEMDYKYVSYIFAGFSPCLVMLLTNDSKSAFHTRCSRIRKKIRQSNSPRAKFYLDLFLFPSCE